MEERMVNFSAAHRQGTGIATHLDSADTLLADKVDRDGKQCVRVVARDLKLETAAAGAGRLADLVDRPLEVSGMRVERVRAVRGRFRDGRLGAGREGDRDDDVVEREGRVLKLVLEVDGDRASVGRRPAVDCATNQSVGE
jgi:hypothetical protein